MKNPAADWGRLVVGAGAEIGSLGGIGGLAVGAGVGAAFGLIGAIVGAVGGDSEDELSDKEKAEIKEVMISLTKILSEEDVEHNLQAQLLALAEQQQADELFEIPTSEEISRTPYQLGIEIQEIGLFKMPEDQRGGKLWLAVNARLADPKQQSLPIEKRICYGSQNTDSLVSWNEANGKNLKVGLTQAYRYISNQILTEMVGLASDPGTISIWDKTDLVCVEERNEKESDTPGKN